MIITLFLHPLSCLQVQLCQVFQAWLYWLSRRRKKQGKKCPIAAQTFYCWSSCVRMWIHFLRIVGSSQYRKTGREGALIFSSFVCNMQSISYRWSIIVLCCYFLGITDQVPWPGYSHVTIDMLRLFPEQTEILFSWVRAFFSKQAFFFFKLHLSFLLCPKDHWATEIRTPTTLLTS